MKKRQSIYLCACAIIALVMSCIAQAACTLTGETSNPKVSTFIPGEPVSLTFTVTGLQPAETGISLQITMMNEWKSIITKMDVPVTADAQGAWKTTITAPNAQLGFYRVFAKLSNGVELPKCGSRQAGYLTYCIVPDPAQRPLYPEKETFFALSGGIQYIFPYLGVRWVGGGYQWRHFEPDHAGQFAETHAKALAQPKEPALTWNGKPWKVYTLSHPGLLPKWPTIPETYAGTTGALTPEGEKAWKEFCTVSAKALTTELANDDQHIYEVTWEPEYPWGYKGTPEQLVRIYEIAYPALHAADPKAMVVGPTRGGLSGEDPNFEAGLGKYLDGYALHPYNAFPPERNGMVEKIRRTKEMLKHYAGKDLPILGTEQGFATGENPDKELEQALGLIREHLIMLGEGARMNWGFYTHDYCYEPGYGYYYNLTTDNQWSPNKVSPKPVVPAFAATTFLLEGTTHSTPIEWLGDTAWGYVYERPGRLVLGLWDYGDQPRQVTLPVGVAQVTVYDWMGNAKTVKTPNGKLTLALTQAPVYIKGVSAQLWSYTAPKPLQFSQARATACPGDTVTLQGTVAHTPGKPFQGTITIEGDERLKVKSVVIPIALAPAVKGKPFTITLSIPKDTPLGSYAMKAVLRSKEGPVAASACRLTVAPPFEIQRTIGCVPTHGSGQDVRVIMRNTQGQPMSGSITISLTGVPESTQATAFSMSAKSEKTVTVHYDDLDITPLHVYQATVTVRMKSGWEYHENHPVNFMSIPYVATAPTIDGTVTDWSDIQAYTLNGSEWVSRSPQYYQGANDLAAKVRYAWNEKALCLAYEVTDDVFYQPNTEFQIWKADCVQLGVNLDPLKAEATTGNQLMDTGSKRRCSEINFALTPKGPQTYRSISFSQAQYPIAEISLEKLPLAVVAKDGKIYYEAAIPWSELGMTAAPHAGDLISLASTINDADDEKQLDPTALGIFKGIAPVKNPDEFGILTLGGKE